MARLRWMSTALVSLALLAVRAGPALATDGGRSPVRGVVRPVESPAISTEAALKAVELPFREGEAFRKGDTLARFDCRRQQGELDAARAAERESALTLESLVHLDRHRAVGRNDVEIARARNARAVAEVAGLAPRLDECRLIAPFDGRIVELSLRTHERTVPQKPFLAIIDDRRLEIELIAPSAMLASLAAGRPFAFLVDELDGRAVPATVARIGAVVDPVSKTVKIMGALAGSAEGLLAGMSGTARFEGARP